MSPEILTMLMFGLFFSLLAVGVPLAWATGGLGALFAFFLWGPDSLSIVVLCVWDVMGSFNMIAIPLFVFMGGVGPGILFASLYIGYILIKCYLNPAAGPAATEEEQNMPLAEKLTMLKLMIMPLLLIVTIIGSIFSGICTPGEAAGIGAVGALLCAFQRRKLTRTTIEKSLFETMKTTGLILWIVFGAMVFIATYTLGGGAEFVKTTLLNLPLNPWVVLIIIQLLLLFLGMVLDIIGIKVLLAPIVVPVVTGQGFDPMVWCDFQSQSPDCIPVATFWLFDVLS